MNIHQFTPGDLVSLYGEEKGKAKKWYGEVIDTDEKNTVLVSLLEKTKEQEGKIWRFSGAESRAPLESITHHVVPTRPLTRRTMKKAWRELGFAVGVDDFCRTHDELCVTLDLGANDSDSDSDEEYTPDSTTDEETDEEFGLAIDEDDFTAETHEIVEAWNNWEPTTSAEKRFKAVVDRIEAREMRKADDRAFSRGEAAPDYRRPAKRRRK